MHGTWKDFLPLILPPNGGIPPRGGGGGPRQPGGGGRIPGGGGPPGGGPWYWSWDPIPGGGGPGGQQRRSTNMCHFSLLGDM